MLLRWRSRAPRISHARQNAFVAIPATGHNRARRIPPFFPPFASLPPPPRAANNFHESLPERLRDYAYGAQEIATRRISKFIYGIPLGKMDPSRSSPVARKVRPEDSQFRNFLLVWIPAHEIQTDSKAIRDPKEELRTDRPNYWKKDCRAELKGLVEGSIPLPSKGVFFCKILFAAGTI